MAGLPYRITVWPLSGELRHLLFNTPVIQPLAEPVCLSSILRSSNFVTINDRTLPNGDGITPGQTHEASAFDTLLESADAHLLDGNGQRIAWPVSLGGDKGYRADWIDEYLLELGICPVIPSKENEDWDARPVEFDREAYRQRNIIERLIG